jgi:hypothetical protein
MKASRLYALSLALVFSGCKFDETSSDVNSGLAGEPSSWTCYELKTEYGRKRSELAGAISTFESSYKALEEAGRVDKPQDAQQPAANSQTSVDQPSDTQVAATDNSFSDVPSSDAGMADATSSSFDEGLALADDGVQSTIGEGADAIPQLPAVLAGIDPTDDNAAVACDKALEKFSQSSNTQVLEQCRYVAELYVLVSKIKNEYNNGRKGECRSGKAAFQTGQTSVRFPFCQNACRFGQTTCVKCTFTAGVSSHYICGEEQDTRAAIELHCKEGGYGCSGQTAQCLAPAVYNEQADGLTGSRESNNTVQVTANVNTKLEGEWDEGVVVRVHQETRIEATITGTLTLKNDRGAPITTANGGETASFYSCSIAVTGAVVRETGVDVGAGFDVVVASGSATAGVNAEFSAMTEFKTSTPDVPASGQPLVNMLEGCKRYAQNWATAQLPALVKSNVVVKAVASRFMGQTRDVMSRDVSGIYCLTNKGGTTTTYKTYRVTQIRAGLADGGIPFTVSYDGYYNRFDGSKTGSITEASIGRDLYVSMRQKIANDGPDGLSDADIRAAVKNVGGDGFSFTDCSKTGW